MLERLGRKILFQIYTEKKTFFFFGCSAMGKTEAIVRLSLEGNTQTSVSHTQVINESLCFI